MIIARTRKGHGVEFMEKQPQAWHLGLLSPEQYADVVAEITARIKLSEASETSETSEASETEWSAR